MATYNSEHNDTDQSAARAEQTEAAVGVKKGGSFRSEFNIASLYRFHSEWACKFKLKKACLGFIDSRSDYLASSHG